MRALFERRRALALALICPYIAATLGPDLYAEVFGPLIHHLPRRFSSSAI